MNSRHHVRFGRTAWALCAALILGQDLAADENREWRFEVQLDGSPIGFHNFRVNTDGAVTTVDSEAEFKVRFLLFTAYRYSHAYREVWDGNCLAHLRSRTDDNGKSYTVHGGRNAQGFHIRASEEQQTLKSCVLSFAYWNPAILRQAALVNGQTGDYEPIDVRPSGQDLVLVDGEKVEARRFELAAGDKRITVWYAPSGEWLGLESEVDGGRMLRYVLTERPVMGSKWADLPPSIDSSDS